jgi:hypothetical protein
MTRAETTSLSLGISENLQHERSIREHSPQENHSYFLPRRFLKPIIVFSAFFTS